MTTCSFRTFWIIIIRIFFVQTQIALLINIYLEECISFVDNQN